jgi:hypothetical protein
MFSKAKHLWFDKRVERTDLRFFSRDCGIRMTGWTVTWVALLKVLNLLPDLFQFGFACDDAL